MLIRDGLFLQLTGIFQVLVLVAPVPDYLVFQLFSTIGNDSE